MIVNEDEQYSGIKDYLKSQYYIVGFGTMVCEHLAYKGYCPITVD